ncbi:MAG: indolepyruvate/phenylpyruvate decarboxylase [Terriglobia bacterium]
MKLYEILFNELYQQGVRKIFGIPGDFALNLFEALALYEKLQLVTFSHEPAVGFAADGASRISNGLAVCCVTYGAGGLNMLNSVACAYAEMSPLVVISGGPGKIEKESGILVHHQVKSFDTQINVYREVVEYAAILDDPRTAALHIRRAIDTALQKSRPVYLEVPRDMVFAEIEESESFGGIELKINHEALKEASQEIIVRLNSSRMPVLIVGVEAHRYRLQEKVLHLAEKLQIPVASSFLGRGIFPVRHQQFIGTYLGTASPEAMRRVVESSDCLLMLGVMMTDTSLGILPETVNASNTILCVSRSVAAKQHVYHDVPLNLLIDALLDSSELPRKGNSLPQEKMDVSPSVNELIPPNSPIRVTHLIQVLNDFVDQHPELPLVADTGDCLFASVDIRSNQLIAPSFYGTMGFAVPAGMGVQLAGGKRPLILVGDGAFQMTGSEISQAPRYGLNPIIVLFNNSRWEMLQVFFPHAKYNENIPWPFAKLAESWGGRGFEVRTSEELRSGLAAAWEETRFVLMDVHLEKGDISPILREFVKGVKGKVHSRSGG